MNTTEYYSERHNIGGNGATVIETLFHNPWIGLTQLRRLTGLRGDLLLPAIKDAGGVLIRHGSLFSITFTSRKAINNSN